MPDAPEYEVSSERERLQLDVIHGFLRTAYWCEGIPRQVIARSIENSFCFGVYRGAEQVGFARVITDFTTFAYVADVFILDSHRGRGLGKLLIRAIVEHPRLQNLRRWLLVTRDAHGLYEHAGFKPLADAKRHMERLDDNVYRR